MSSRHPCGPERPWLPIHVDRCDSREPSEYSQAVGDGVLGDARIALTPSLWINSPGLSLTTLSPEVRDPSGALAVDAGRTVIDSTLALGQGHDMVDDFVAADPGWPELPGQHIHQVPSRILPLVGNKMVVDPDKHARAPLTYEH